MSGANNIFIDTNILIGAYASVEEDRRCLHYLYSLTGKRLFVSSLSVAQLVSVFQKHKLRTERIKAMVKDITAKTAILSFTGEDIAKSMTLKQNDMEDNMQYVISRKMKCAYIVTNNRRDYNRYPDITAVDARRVRSIE